MKWPFLLCQKGHTAGRNVPFCTSRHTARGTTGNQRISNSYKNLVQQAHCRDSSRWL